MSFNKDVKTWWKLTTDDEGRPHSYDDMPASQRYDHGFKVRKWFRNGYPHRDGGLPSEISDDGSMRYFVNGKLHRTDGPAVIKADGTELYFIEGMPQLDKNPPPKRDT